MSKKNRQFTDSVMQRIHKEKIRITPRWWFVLGSVILSFGLGAVVFISSLVWRVGWLSFNQRSLASLLSLGPIGRSVFWNVFPWEWLLLGVGGILIGAGLVRQHYFAYKKDPLQWVLLLLLASVVIAATLRVLPIDRYLVQMHPIRMYMQESYVGERFVSGKIVAINNGLVTLVTANGEDIDVVLPLFSSPPAVGERFIFIGSFRNNRFEAVRAKQLPPLGRPRP